MNAREKLKIAKESGRRGGYKRAAKLSAKRRAEIARDAANARWGKERKSMSKLLPHSLYLLRHVIENNGYCVTVAIPCILQDGTPEPLGMSMATMRGLEKRGYVTESHSGIWRATDSGRRAAENQVRKPNPSS